MEINIIESSSFNLISNIKNITSNQSTNLNLRDSENLINNSVQLEQQNSENLVILSEDERENTIEEQIVCFFDEPVIDFLPNHDDINTIIMESNIEVIESNTDIVESSTDVELNPSDENPFEDNVIDEEKTCNISEIKPTDIQISDNSDFSENNCNKTILENSLDDDDDKKNDVINETDSITVEECLTPVKKQTAVLGKEQIKKRLQSFSLLKQGINATPIKKIIKQPKLNLRIVDEYRYDENGMKIDEKIVIKKPSKRGPNPQDKAKATIDEIEELKKEQLVNWEKTQNQMCIPTKNFRKKGKDKFESKNDTLEKSVEHRKKSKDRHRSSERDSKKSKDRHKSLSQDDKMPENWVEVKDSAIEFEKINKLKQKVLKPMLDKNDRKEKRNRRYSDELNRKPIRREDIMKAPLMFEHPSMLRCPFPVISNNDEHEKKDFPQEIIKFTEKYPSISFCENPYFARGYFRTRRQVLHEVPKERAEIMIQFIENRSRKPYIAEKIKARNWYPRKYLFSSEEHPMSYGLSRLSESYLDDPDDIEDFFENNPDKNIVSPSLSPKTKPIKNKEFKSDNQSFQGNDKNDAEKSKDKEKNKDINSVQIENKDKNETTISKEIKNFDMLPNGLIESENIDKTPNTDEYRSNWESGEEELLLELLPSNDVHVNKSWGSEGNLLDIDLKEKKKEKSTKSKSKEKDIKRNKRSTSTEIKSSRRSIESESDKHKKDRRKYYDSDDNYNKSDGKCAEKHLKSKFDDKHKYKDLEFEEKLNKLEHKHKDSDYYNTKVKYNNKTEYKNKYDKHKDIELRTKYEELKDKYDKKRREEFSDKKERRDDFIDKKDRRDDFIDKKERREDFIDKKERREDFVDKKERRDDIQDKKERREDFNDKKERREDITDKKERKDDFIDKKERREDFNDKKERYSKDSRENSIDKYQNKQDKKIHDDSFEKYDGKYNYKNKYSKKDEYESYNDSRKKIQDDNVDKYDRNKHEEMSRRNKHEDSKSKRGYNENIHSKINDLDESKKYDKSCKKDNSEKGKRCSIEDDRYLKKTDDKYSIKKNKRTRDSKSEDDERDLKRKNSHVEYEEKDKKKTKNLEQKEKENVDITPVKNIEESLTPEELFDIKTKNFIQRDSESESIKIKNESENLKKNLDSKPHESDIKITLLETGNNSWSTDEEDEQESLRKLHDKKNDLLDKVIEFAIEESQKSSKYFDDTKNKKQKKKEKDQKKKVKKNKKEIVTYKNEVKIDYSDYEKNLEDSYPNWYQNETKMIKPRNIIKIDYSDFDSSLLVAGENNKEREVNVLKEKIENSNSPLSTTPPKRIVREIIDLKDFNLTHDTSSPKVDKSSNIINFNGTESIKLLAGNPKLNIETKKQSLMDNFSLSPKQNLNISKLQQKFDSPRLDTSSNKDSSIDIVPVAPPASTEKSHSYLASEYEEFMKACCFDSSQDYAEDSSFDQDYQMKTPEVIVQKEKLMQIKIAKEKERLEQERLKDIEKEVECVKSPGIEKEHKLDSDKEKLRQEEITKEQEIEKQKEMDYIKKMKRNDYEKHNESSDETSSSTDSSDSDSTSDSSSESSSSSSSDSEDSYEVIHIKQEKLSDAELEQTAVEEIVRIHKRKLADDIQSEVTQKFIKKEKFDDKLNYVEVRDSPQNEINASIESNEKSTQSNNTKSLSEIESITEESPKVVSTDSDSTLLSPLKKRSFIPIKLLTAESRKQANDNATVSTDFGICKNIDDKTVSSTENILNNQKIASFYESLPPIEITPRKRPSNVTLNITPVKKIMIEPAVEDEESDEDFTERFIKHVEPKDKSKSEKELKSQVEENLPKSEERIRKDEDGKDNTDKDKSKKAHDSDKLEKNTESFRRYDSRDRRESDRRSGDRNRDRLRKDSRERRRSPERRRREYSRERDIRVRRRSKDRDRNVRRRSRDRDDKYYNRSRRYSRSPTPKKIFDDHVYHKSSPSMNYDNTNFSTTSMDIVQSPVNSPMDGLKRSLADSTISDSELSKRNTQDECNESSPRYPIPTLHHTPRIDSPASPKRISLDDRINLVLGIEKEPPKSIDTVCTRGQYDTGHQPTYQETYQYGRSEYDNYNMLQADYSNPYNQQYSTNYQQPYQHSRTENNIKVVQIGNVIQVVPTEQPPLPKPVLPKVNLSEMPPKVVQVGNMLQIVPIQMDNEHIEENPVIPSLSQVETVASPVKVTDQLVIERRAEKEQRRLEREQRRKEKERKRKEKEKRRQLKMKLKTENMIKRALLLDTSEVEPDEIDDITETETIDIGESRITSLPWPPATLPGTLALNKTPTKGILVSQGFSQKNATLNDEEKEIRKIVKFADGICPGEGTSPSGGEDLPSPPPPPRKLPKEKRYKKIHGKNKKKVKVKIIRQPLPEEDDSDDNLPPPPPPPGSPPPHLWPPRVKPINNIHTQIPASIYPTSPFPQTVLYRPAYPPAPPVSIVVQQSPRHLPVLPVQPSTLQHIAPGSNIHQGPPLPPLHPGPPPSQQMLPPQHIQPHSGLPPPPHHGHGPPPSFHAPPLHRHPHE